LALLKKTFNEWVGFYGDDFLNFRPKVWELLNFE